MLYLVRTTDGAAARMRDGKTLKDPVLEVTSSRYTVFKNLPGGLEVGQSADVEVKLAADEFEAEEIQKRYAGHVAASMMDADDYDRKVQAKIDRIMRKQRGEPEPWEVEGFDRAPNLQEVMAAGYKEDEARQVVVERLKLYPPAEDDLVPDDGTPPLELVEVKTETELGFESEPETEEPPSPKGKKGRGKK